MDRANVFKGNGPISAAMLLAIVASSGLSHAVAADPCPIRGVVLKRDLRPLRRIPSAEVRVEIAAWNAAVDAKKHAKKGV